MKKFLVLFLIIFFLPLNLFSQDCPYIGAIRWDAWHGDKGKVGVHVQNVLSKKKWHKRVPFCAQILNDEIRINCATPEAMEKEIRYAKEALLDYWAFLIYEPDNEMSLQLSLYFESSIKHFIKFAPIIQFGRWSMQNYKDMNDYITRLFNQENYLTINDRPVLFIFNITKFEKKLYEHWKGVENFKNKVLKDLINKTIEVTGNKPYFIVMEFNPEKAKYWADLFNFDAISTYATHPGKRGTFQDLAKQNVNYWNRAKQTGKTVIPIVMAGWDPRPRAENPAPWQDETYLKRAQEIYFDTPKPEEIAEHLRNAIRWAKQNSSPAVIIYAWNEFDEGGWIMPTLLEGDNRIKAIRKIIERECSK